MQIHRRLGQSVAVVAMMVIATAATMGTARADDVQRARSLYKRAEHHYSEGRYARAKELYEQAYQAKPLAGFHFNIAQCYRKLNNCGEAIRHYQLYLDKSKSAPHADEARRLIRICKRQKDERAARQRELAGGGDAELPPGTGPAGGQPAAGGSGETGSPAPGSKPPASGGKREGLSPLFFWASAGFTAAMLLTMTITGSLALSKSSEFNDPQTPLSDLRDLQDSGESLRTAANVTFALTLVGAAATATLFFFTDFGSRETAVAAMPSPQGGTFAVTGRF